MAKRFKDIHGVLLSETYTDGRGEKTTKETYFGYDNKNYHYDIKSYGDTLYMLDRNNNFEIVELLVKQKSMNYHGFATISAVKLSDAENVKEYIPYHYGSSSDSKYKKYFITTCVRGNRSHAGLFFTELKEAQKYQKQLRDKIGFIFLKKGDHVYLVSGSDNLVEATVSKAIETKEYDKDVFVLDLGELGQATFNQMRYEERATDLLETYFYAYRLNLGGDKKIYIKKEDAEKAIKDAEQRKRKSATDKYLKSIENHDGKPISHHDKKGKQLHYGDKVAYAVSRGSSAPYISFGIVKGESKEKVSIIDEETYGKEKEIKHSVSPGCILLVKEAEYNTSSGYSFVKGK